MVFAIKDKEEKVTVAGGAFFNITNLCLPVQPSKLEKLLYCRGFIWRRAESNISFKPWDLATEREAHKHLALKANEACVQSFTGSESGHSTLRNHIHALRNSEQKQ